MSWFLAVPKRPRSPRIFAVTVVAIAASVVLFSTGCTDGYVPSEEDQSDASSSSDGSGSGGGNGGGTGGDAWTEPGGDGSEVDSRDSRDGDNDEVDGERGTSCTPDGDGSITREEVPLRAGLRAVFEVANDVEVDTTGRQEDGERTWDYAKEYPGDHAEVIELQSMEGKWFRSDFPDADYAMKLAGDSDELGVFKTTREALLMVGVVSPEDDGTTTNVEFDPPVPILDFPLEEGKIWQHEADASGTHATWGPVTYSETYTMEVDSAGTLKTPYGSFEVLRVYTSLDRESTYSGFPLGSVRTFAFVAECFGTVATIRSKQDESEKEFEEAAELRRLSQ